MDTKGNNQPRPVQPRDTHVYDLHSPSCKSNSQNSHPTTKSISLGQRIRIPTFMLASLRHMSLAHFSPQLLKLEKANTSLGSIFWMSQLEETSERKSWWCLVTSKPFRQIQFGQKSLKGKSPRTCSVAKGPDLKQGMLARYRDKRTTMPVDMGQTIMQKGVGWWKDMDIE